MSGSIFIPLGAGVLSALLHLSATSGSPSAIFVTYFAQAPLAAAGLALGFMPAAVAAAFAAVIVALVSPSAGALTLFLTVSALPILMVVYFALQNRTTEDGTVEWYPIGRLLGWLTALGLAAFGGALVLSSAAGDGLQAAIREFLVPLKDAFSVSSQPQNADAVLDAIISMMVRYSPGMMVASWMMMIIVNCTLAQQFLTLAGKNLRPKPAYRDAVLPIWPAGILAMGLAATFFGGFPGFIGINVAIIASAPFFFIGLAVVHSITAAWQGRIIALICFYIAILSLLWPVGALVAILGILEHWLRLRDRTKAASTNKGND